MISVIKTDIIMRSKRIRSGRKSYIFEKKWEVSEGEGIIVDL